MQFRVAEIVRETERSYQVVDMGGGSTYLAFSMFEHVETLEDGTEVFQVRDDAPKYHFALSIAKKVDAA